MLRGSTCRWRFCYLLLSVPGCWWDNQCYGNWGWWWWRSNTLLSHHCQICISQNLLIGLLFISAHCFHMFVKKTLHLLNTSIQLRNFAHNCNYITTIYELLFVYILIFIIFNFIVSCSFMTAPDTHANVTIVPAVSFLISNSFVSFSKWLKIKSSIL